jgi:hypothetical protein
MKTQILAVTVALSLSACGGGSSSPNSPSPLPPQPAPSAAANWTVAQTFVSVTGPDNCWIREQRSRLTGAVFGSLPMTITRSGGAITVDGDFFQVNYTGTISGNEFSATGRQPLAGGGTPCQDGTSFQQRPGVSSLSGTFSADDQLMTASEVNAYTLTSGEPVVYTWAWRATRRN